MEDLLKKIVENTRSKESLQIIVSGDKTLFTTNFNPLIRLDYERKYEIALVNLETYYSFPNINESNSTFIYSPDSGASWHKIIIPVGSYDLIDINDTIHQEMRKNGHVDLVNDNYPINISVNTNTLKSILVLENSYEVDFNHPNSISKALGFTHEKYVNGFHESENVVNILSINSVLVNVNIISGSYVNGFMRNTIYSFFPKQLKHNAKMEEGFLGMLAGLAASALPAIAKTVLPALGVGALSGLASSGVQKAMGLGLYLKKGGRVCRVETDGEGLYLSPYKGKGLKSAGNGLYLKRGGKFYGGKGLILGPNSPFANIPILGAML